MSEPKVLTLGSSRPGIQAVMQSPNCAPRVSREEHSALKGAFLLLTGPLLALVQIIEVRNSFISLGFHFKFAEI